MTTWDQKSARKTVKLLYTSASGLWVTRSAAGGNEGKWVTLINCNILYVLNFKQFRKHWTKRSLSLYPEELLGLNLLTQLAYVLEEDMTWGYELGNILFKNVHSVKLLELRNGHAF